MGFELGFEKNNFLGNGIRTPPSQPSNYIASFSCFETGYSEALHDLYCYCRSDKGCKFEGPMCNDLCTINLLILSMTKFSIVIGSSRAYSSCNRPDN